MALYITMCYHVSLDGGHIAERKRCQPKANMLGCWGPFPWFGCLEVSRLTPGVVGRPARSQEYVTRGLLRAFSWHSHIFQAPLQMGTSKVDGQGNAYPFPKHREVSLMRRETVVNGGHVGTEFARPGFATVADSSSPVRSVIWAYVVCLTWCRRIHHRCFVFRSKLG